MAKFLKKKKLTVKNTNTGPEPILLFSDSSIHD